MFYIQLLFITKKLKPLSKKISLAIIKIVIFSRSLFSSHHQRHCSLSFCRLLFFSLIWLTFKKQVMGLLKNHTKETNLHKKISYSPIQFYVVVVFRALLYFVRVSTAFIWLIFFFFVLASDFFYIFRKYIYFFTKHKNVLKCFI